MENLRISARTVEEAIQAALDQLNVGREEVEVDVIKEGKSGILGLGTDEAVVEVRLLEVAPEGDKGEVAIEVLSELLSRMGVGDAVVSRSLPGEDQEATDDEVISLEINGSDLGILIGRRGQTLASLQYITRLIVGHKTGDWLPIVIDIEGYKQRRYQSLRQSACYMAEQVTARNTPFTMEPMPAYERRIVHLALAEHEDVITESIGQSDSRRVVILPREK